MHFLPFTKSSYLKPTLKLSALSVMVAALSGCGEDAKDCGGFWDKTFGRDDCQASQSQVQASGQVFGPIAAATLTVSSPTDANSLNLFVEENKTDSNGKFILANKLKAPIYTDGYYLLSAHQGSYLDVNGDGVIDGSPSTNKGVVSGLVKGSQLEKNNVKLSILTDIAWRYSKYHINDFSSQDIETRLTDIANVFFTQDISGDNVIDDKDLLAFDPTNTTHLQRLSFNYSFLFNKDKGDLINAYLQGDDAKIDEVIDSLFGLYLSRYQGKDARSNQVKIEVLPFGKGNYASDDGKITYKSDGSIKALSSFYDKKNGFVTVTASPDADTQILDWSGCYSVSEDKTKCQVSTLADTQVVVSFGYKEAKIVDNYIDLSRARSAFDGDSKIHVTVNHGDDELVTKMQSLQQGYFVTGIAEYGYLRKVTAITKLSDYKYTLETEQAALDDIILEGTGVYSKKFTAADLGDNVAFVDDNNSQKARSVSVKKEITPATPADNSVVAISPYDGIMLIKPSNPNSNKIKLQIGKSVPSKAKASVDSNLSIGGKAELDWITIVEKIDNKDVDLKIRGAAELELGLEVGFDYSLIGGLQSFKSIPYIQLKGDVEFGAVGQYKLEDICKKSGKSKCAWQLAEIPLAPVTFFIGPVPVYVHNSVKIFFTLDGKLEASVSAFAELDTAFKAGLLWHKNKGVTGVVEANFDPDVGVSVGGKAEVKVAIGPAMKVFFYNVTGPEIPTELYAKAEAELVGNNGTNGLEEGFWKESKYKKGCKGGIDYAVAVGASSKLLWGTILDDKGRDIKIVRSLQDLLAKTEIEVMRKAEFTVYSDNILGECEVIKAPPKLKVVGDHIEESVTLGEAGSLIKSYVISNIGGTAMDWKLDYIPDGVLTIKDNKGVEKTSGKLEAGDSETISVVIDKSKLNLGAYVNKLRFQNGVDEKGLLAQLVNAVKNFLTEKSVHLNVIPAKANINSPEQFTAELFKPTIALLKWSYPTNTQYGYLVKGYRVFISENGEDWEMYQTITDKNRHFLHVPNLLTKKTYYFAIDAYMDDISSDVVKKELFVPAIVPTGDCRAHFSGILMGDTFDDKVSYTSEVYVEDAYSEYVGPGLYPDNTQAFPKAIATTFDGIAIDKGTKVTIYSQKDFKGEILYEKVGPAIINNSIWRGYDVFRDPVERNWKEPLQTTYPQSVREWSVGNMHPWSNGSLMVECGYSK